MFVTAKNKAKRSEIFFFFLLRSENFEAKRSEKISPLFSLEQAKTKQKGSRFALKRKNF
jgi:hypothetical protein